VKSALDVRKAEREYRKDSTKAASRLFLASFVGLFFELLVIRYLTTEVRAFTNLKNLPLIACFFGIGLGVVLGERTNKLRTAFPILGSLLFLSMRFSSWLHLSASDLLWNYGLSQTSGLSVFSRALITLRFLTVIAALLTLVVGFFVFLGGLIGGYWRSQPPLRAYGINLAGSLTGVILFSVLASLNSPPAVWFLVGFAASLPFIIRQPLSLLLFALSLACIAIPQPNTYWSPYHRIDLIPLPPWENGKPLAYSLVADHGWYQEIANLSPGFLSRHPSGAQPFLVQYYDIPYRLVPNPRNVLILGTGVGDDIAGALRNGAEHIDAVEIDPVILAIGRKYHPEHPYDSPRVTAHVDDARAFLRKTKAKYDVIVFGFLDSSILLSSFSSLRLDNYVYTLQSFQEARRLLAANGTLVVSFATGRNFATDRLFATLTQAFGETPRAYLTRYRVDGVLLVEGKGRETNLPGLEEVTQEVTPRARAAIVATDQWPFLYLERRSIPGSILAAAGIFILGAWAVLRKLGCISWKTNPSLLHFFFLGAGFLLLETKAVTQLSLLFGSTWIVNSVVIASFLLLAILSNLSASFWAIPKTLSYAVLFLLLAADLWFPYSSLAGSSLAVKAMVAGTWAALPVFFSGLIFSQGLSKETISAEALGINLFGAVIGGVLENVVMLGGTTVLVALAAGFYALSAIPFLYREST
jgi:SAM-dependent methyltransferase